MADAILKIVISPYLSEKSSDFGKFKAALMRYQAASFSSNFMQFALFTSHKTYIVVVIMFDQVFNNGIRQSSLLHFRPNFMTRQLTSSACCSVIGCNTLQHSTRNQQKLTCQFFVVASSRSRVVSRIVLVTTPLQDYSVCM